MDTENVKEELLERIAEARGAAIRARGDELDEATKEIEALEPMLSKLSGDRGALSEVRAALEDFLLVTSMLRNLFQEALLGSDDQGRQSVKGYGAAGAAKRGAAGPRLLRGYS